MNKESMYDIFALFDTKLLAEVREKRAFKSLLPGYKLLERGKSLNSNGNAEECKQELLAAIQARIDELDAFRSSLLTLDEEGSLKTWFYETEGGKKLKEGWRAVLDADLDQLLQLADHAKLSTDGRDAAGYAIQQLVRAAGVDVTRSGWQGGQYYTIQLIFIVGDKALVLQHKKEQDSGETLAAGTANVELVDGAYKYTGLTKDHEAAKALATVIAAKVQEHCSKL